MKYLNKLLFLFVVLAISSINVFSQVSVNGTNYTTLAAGFAAINAGSFTGDIVIKITGNTTESSVAFLNASGNGNAPYSSVLIYPTGSYTISGNLTNGLVELRGADNVTIDGRANQSGTTRSLTIKNNSTSTSAAIWLDSLTSGSGGGCTNIKITYCNLETNTITSAYGVTMGASTSLTAAGAGFENIEISYNRIIKAYMGIRAYGLSNSAVKNIKIFNNIIGSTTTGDQVTYTSVYLYYVDYAEVYNNDYVGISHTSTSYTNYIYYTTNSKFYGNTIQNANTASALYIFYFVQSGSNELYNNTIKNVTAASSLYHFYFSSSTSVKVYGNSIEDTKSTGGVNYPFYFTSSGSSEVTNNLVKNAYASSTFYGVYAGSSSSMKINGNKFTNLTSAISSLGAIYVTSSGSSEVKNNVIKTLASSSTMYGIYCASSTYCTINNNSIDDALVNNSTGYGIYLSSATGSEFKNNKVRNWTAFNNNYALYSITGTDQVIEGNTFTNINSNGSSTAGAAGIYIASGNNQRLVNNSIAYIRSTNFGSTSTINNPFGITLAGGTGHKVYYNSVYLSGAQNNVGSSTTLSAAFMITTTSVNGVDIRNNVFANELTSTVNGSKFYAIYMAGSSNLTNSGVINYNDYFVGGAQGILGYWAGADRTTIALWRSSTSQDQNSFSINPIFNSYILPSPAPGSQIVGLGTPITGISVDILNKPRSSSAPTPGAFENADDIIGPDIVFDKLTTTTSTSNRTLVATITDFSGVNNSTNAPRLYYKKTTNSNTFINNTNSSNGWKFATAVVNGNQYSFTLDYSRIFGGVASGEMIEYFIITMDNSSNANVSFSNGEFFNVVNSTNLTSNDFPFNDALNYGLAYSLTGTYNVGTNQQFTSLTSEGGFFQYANNAVLIGNVTINITSNTSETGAFELGKIPEEFGNGWTITIKPLTTSQYLLSGSFTGALFRIIGTNNLTIDGSINGAGNYLEFNNAASSGTRATFMIGSGGTSINGGKNITLTNIKITGAAPTTTTSIGLLLSDASLSTAGSSGAVNNFTLKNSEIYRVMYATITRGTSALPLLNLLIENNIVGSDNSNDYIYQYGLDVQFAPNAMIRGNKIYNSIHSAGSNKYAIQLGGTQTPGINVIGNWIHSFKYNGTGGWGCYGVNIIGGNDHLIANNMISDLTTDRYSATSTAYNPFAIRITSGTGHKIWHNTINMYGMQGGTNTVASLTSVICITSTAINNLDVRGNVFNNTLEGLSGTRSFIYYSTATFTNAFRTLERNMINIGSNQGAISGFGTAVPFTETKDLDAFKQTFGFDMNSVVGVPKFISNYNLHLTGDLLGNSTYMVTRSVDVLTDYDGENRNLQTFYGADEMNPIFAITSNTSASPNQAVYCYGQNVELSFTAGITGYGDGIARTGAPGIGYAWFKNGEYLNLPMSNKLGLANINKSDSANYYAKAYFMDKELTSNTLHIKAEAPMVMTKNISNAEVCNNNPVLQMDVDAIGTITGYQWEKYNPNKSSWEEIKNANTKVLLIPLANPEEAIGQYRARVIGPGNCGPAAIYSNVSKVNVTVPISNEKAWAEFNTQAVCKGDRIEFFGHAEGTIFGYQWQYSAGGSFVDLPIEEFPTAKSTHLIIDNATPEMSGKYRLVVYGSYACDDDFVPSNEIDVYVYPTFEIEDQPKEQTACVGETVNLGIYANGQITGYQWYRNDIPITLEENPNANKQFIQFKNVTYKTSGKYYCVITYEDCSGIKTLQSHIAPIYVATNTVVTHKPETQAAALGGNAYFTFKAHVNGLPNTYEIPVQWYRGDEPLVDDGRIQGAGAQILHISNVQESDYREDYRLVLQGLCGTTEIKDFGIVKVDINITEQPASIEQCEGTMAVFNVKANSTIGADQITYAWYKDGVAIYDGGRISGTNTNKLIISNVNADDAGDYYVKVGLKGAANTATSLPASMTINPLPAFTLNLENELTVKEEDLLELYVATTGGNVKYQWYFNGYKIDGATEDVLIIDEVKPENAGDYYVTATNNCGTVKSNVTKLTVTPKTSTNVDDNLSFVSSLDRPTPHPVNSVSEIKFTMNNTANVELALYDINGKKIEVLFDGLANLGTNSVKLDANKFNLISGTYMLVLTSNNKTITQTITIIK